MEYEVFLDELIDEMIERLAFHATAIQTRIDSFIVIQGRNLTREQIGELILSGSSSNVLAEVDAAKNLIIRTLSNTVTEAAQAGLSDFQNQNYEDAQLFRWTLGSAKHCGDCLGRSGQEETRAYWQSVGEPRDGATICGSSCNCILEPVK